MLEWHIYLVVTIVIVVAVIAAIVYFVRGRLRKARSRQSPQGYSQE